MFPLTNTKQPFTITNLTLFNCKCPIRLHYNDATDSTRLCLFFGACQENENALPIWQSEPTSITFWCKIQSDLLLYQNQPHIFCQCTQKSNIVTTTKT